MTRDRGEERPEQANGGEDVARPLAPAPVIYAIGLALGIVLGQLIPLGLFPSRLIAFGVGWPCVAAGLALSVWSALVMRKSRESPDPRVPTSAVVSDGPFRLSRNPMYVAFTIGYVGLSLVLNTAWPVTLLPLVIAALHFGIVRREERYLEHRLGRPYWEYCRQVRRWL